VTAWRNRTVIVARLDAFDVEPAIQRRAHLVTLEDHARRLGRLPRRVADVEALDPQLLRVLDFQPECLDQGARADLLRTVLGDVARQRQVRVGLRHLKPVAALSAHSRVARADDLHGPIGRRQRCGKLLGVQSAPTSTRRGHCCST